MKNNTATCWLPQPKICLLAVVKVHCWHSRNLGDIQHPLTSLGVENWRLTNYNNNITCQRTIQILKSDIKNWNKVNNNSHKVSTVALLLVVEVFYKIIIIIVIIIKTTTIYNVMRKTTAVSFPSLFVDCTPSCWEDQRLPLEAKSSQNIATCQNL